MDNREPTDICQQTNVSFFDILLAIAFHKKLFLSIWILISLCGVIAAVMMPAKYSYTTLIGMGTNYEGQLVESASIARAKLNAVIIPVAQRHYIDDGGLYSTNVEVLVKSPSMLSFETRGTIESAQDNFIIHKSIFEALRKEHQMILAKMSENAILKMKEITHTLKELEEEGVLLNKNLIGLDQMDASLKRQAIKSDANAALLHIIIINQMELNRAALMRTLAINIDAKNSKRIDLDNIRKNLDGMSETFYAVPTTQSKSAVAPNRMLVSIGGILSGLLIGILSVLLVDYFTKLRRNER